MRKAKKAFRSSLRRTWRTAAVPLVFGWLLACTGQPELLNSERIEQRFGSYGVEILASDPGGRRSNLYSEHDGRRICRTYAVVRFDSNALRSADPALRAAHERVLRGGSVGATLRNAGYDIEKTPRFAGALPVPRTEPGWIRLMNVPTAAGLAVLEYRLTIKKGSQSSEYATIVEVYHPDFVQPAELQSRYPREARVPSAEAAASTLGLLDLANQ